MRVDATDSTDLSNLAAAMERHWAWPDVPIRSNGPINIYYRTCCWQTRPPFETKPPLSFGGLRIFMKPAHDRRLIIKHRRTSPRIMILVISWLGIDFNVGGRVSAGAFWPVAPKRPTYPRVHL